MENQQNPNPTPKDGVIKRAARWVARMFGYKSESKFGRVVWYLFSTAVTILAIYLVVTLIAIVVGEIRDAVVDWKYERKVNNPTYLHDFCNT